MRIVLAMLLSLFALSFSSCGGNVCKKGDTTCSCATVGTCEWSCSGGSCSGTSSGQGGMTINCAGGGCHHGDLQRQLTQAFASLSARSTAARARGCASAPSA